MKKIFSSSGEADALDKLSRKEIGKGIGSNPDDWDYRNIATLVEIYDKAHPGRIKRMKSDYDVEYALSARGAHGVVASQSDTRLAMWLPGDLQEVLERGYPSIWTNKKHLRWFLRKFPQFRATQTEV